MDALQREVREEIGVASFTVLQKIEEPISYDFTPDQILCYQKINFNYKGQRQYWFLCGLSEKEDFPGVPDLHLAEDDEFSELGWFTPEQAVSLVYDTKKSAYRKALSALGLVSDQNKR